MRFRWFLVALVFDSPELCSLRILSGLVSFWVLHRRQAVLKLVFNREPFRARDWRAIVVFHAVVGRRPWLGPVTLDRASCDVGRQATVSVVRAR